MNKNRQATRRAIGLALAIILFATVGTLLLFPSHAATPTAAIEAENGSLSSCASSVTDSSASNSAAVEFNTCTGATPPVSLDASGNTVPDTDYPIPAGAIFMATSGSDSNSGTQASPVATLAKAYALVPSGGTIVVRGGVYRDGSTTSLTKPLTIQAYPHEQVWFDGTDEEPTSAWTNDGNGQWSMSWNTPSFCGGGYYNYPYNAQSSSGPCTWPDEYGDSSNPAAGDPQMVFEDGTYVHEVTSLSAATGSNFYYDQTNKVIYIGFNPSGHTVELAARPMALALQGGTGPDVVRGIGFRRYATNAYPSGTAGAVMVNVPNSTLENDVFTQNAAIGATIPDPTGAVVNSDIFAFNGSNGLASNGHQHTTGAADGIIVENSVLNNNNTERFGPGCSASCFASNSKMAHLDGFTLENNIFENGVGVAKGFWCDLDCSGGTIVDNVFKNNGGAGLMYEVGNTGIIASNLIYGNGAEGLKMGSANTEVYNNTIVNNAVNVLLYDDSRSPGVGGWTDVGPDTTNTSFVNNVIYGGNNMLEAWRTSVTAPNTGPNTFFTAMDYNSYYRTGGTSQALILWKEGTTSLTTTTYKSLSAFTAAHAWESHGRDVTDGSNPFVNLTGGDYDISPSSPDYHSGTSLPADVAAALGLTTKTIVSRGAITWPGE